MQLDQAGLEAAERTKGYPSTPRSVQTRAATVGQVVEAYLEAAGFLEETEEKGAGKTKKPTGRARLVGPWVQRADV